MQPNRANLKLTSHKEKYNFQKTNSIRNLDPVNFNQDGTATEINFQLKQNITNNRFQSIKYGNKYSIPNNIYKY